MCPQKGYLDADKKKALTSLNTIVENEVCKITAFGQISYVEFC